MVNKNIQFYNVKILAIYIEYLRKQLGWSEYQIDQLFFFCKIDKSILDSEDNWFDQELADLFYKKIVEFTGDLDIAYKVGIFLIDEKAKGIGGRVIGGFLSPCIAFRNIEKIASLYSKGASLKPIKVTDNNAIIRAVVESNCEEKPYQCQNRTGLLEAIPGIFGLPNAVVTHTKCYHKGDQYCEYDISWIGNTGRRLSAINAILLFFAVFGITININDPQTAFLLATAISSVTYSILRVNSDKRLKHALNDQIDALRISMQTIERRRKELQLIRDINNVITRMMPLQDLCDVSARVIREEMNYDRASILTVEQDNKILKVRSFCGFTEKDKKILKNIEFNIRPESNGFLIKVVNTKKPTLVRDVESQLSLLSKRSQHYITELKIKSLLAVPIIFEEQVLGVIVVDNTSQPKYLSNNDLELLKNIAKQMAVAFSNALRYEQIQSDKEMLEEKVADRTSALVTARDEALRASKVKSDFLTNMSHELRTPLNAIMGYAELLQEDAVEMGLQAFVDDLNKIHGGGQHLLLLINNILDLSKIESGKMDLYIEKFSIKALVSDVEAMLIPLARKNNSQLSVQWNSDIELMQADETKLRQSIFNLVSNACKFTKKGKVSIHVGNMKIDNQEWIQLDVVDTGIGMTQEQLSHLFQEFSQADASIARNYGGTGLGLAISKRFCQMMDGDILVTSEYGRGSTFSIKLPVNVNSGKDEKKKIA